MTSLYQNKKARKSRTFLFGGDKSVVIPACLCKQVPFRCASKLPVWHPAKLHGVRSNSYQNKKARKFRTFLFGGDKSVVIPACLCKQAPFRCASKLPVWHPAKLYGVRSNSYQNKKARKFRTFLFGGDKEDRTPDLRIANASLSQLSYIPNTAHIISNLFRFVKRCF